MKIAITGHTLGLGKSFFEETIMRGHEVFGFSRTTGYDLRDYTQVGNMINAVKNFDLFINNAKPDYAQTQILYRLAREWESGIILSVGSSATINFPNWSDTYLLEYLTQKIALVHAHHVLSDIVSCKLHIVHPEHLGEDTKDYAAQVLSELGL
jgi:hypothetical protein